MGASRGQSFQAVDEPKAEAQGGRNQAHSRARKKARVASRLRAGRVGEERGRGVWLGGGRLGYSVHCFGEPAC